ncbi:MAG: RDD family protein [Pirellulales bacterium]
MHDNPYRSPTHPTVSDATDERTSPSAEPFHLYSPQQPLPSVSPDGTTTARYIAAVFDSVLAAAITIVIVKQLPEEQLPLQFAAMATVYLGYFFAFETTWSTTPGKLVTGLKVLSFDGSRCSTKQILIRTLFRLLEVNPLLLGGLPAAVRIVCTRDKQRFGDKFADTVVVFR